MGFVILSVLVQVLTVVHIIRHGRNQMWILAAVMLSIPGCIAYFVVEIGPGLWGGRAEVADRARRLTRQQRAAEARMYDWAATELARLER